MKTFVQIDGVEAAQEFKVEILPDLITATTIVKPKSGPLEGIDIKGVYTLSNRVLSGQFSFFNGTPTVHTVNGYVEVANRIAIAAHLSGSASLLEVDDAGGGNSSCPAGEPALWQAKVGGQLAHGLFIWPFKMSSSGAGTQQTTRAFGNPDPVVVMGPSVSFGVEHAIALTPYDRLTVTSALRVRDRADLNEDGVVDGQDLAVLLGLWNEKGSALRADLDKNGVIDGADLALLLGAWS